MSALEPRRRTRAVQVGHLTIGGDHPVVVQTMTTTRPRDLEASQTAILRALEHGAELVRIAVPTMEDARHLGELTRRLRQAAGCEVPLVADIHHQGQRIALEAAPHVAKLRLNPGLFVFRKPDPGITWNPAEVAAERERIREVLEPVVRACQQHGVALRLGVNHGSLSDRMLVTHGNTPRGMVESALEYVGLCEELGFHELVISLKASSVPVMISANRLFVAEADARGWNYPLHLGVTEAGDGETGRIRSTAGIASLLALGLGDTIRVSLTEDEVHELPVCYDILQALELRITRTELVACPGCGRCQLDLRGMLQEVREAVGHLPGLRVAVMGCVVNGPGEMAGAHYGFVGQGGGRVDLYRNGEVVRRGVPEGEGVRALVQLLRADGRWQEP